MRNLRRRILPGIKRRAKWASFTTLSYSFRAAAGAIDLYANLFPGVRLNRRYALDPRRGFAIIGAEIGMWNAFRPRCCRTLGGPSPVTPLRLRRSDTSTAPSSLTQCFRPSEPLAWTCGSW